MFIGHFGVAFAASAVARRTSLATLFVAAQLADLIWPLLVLAGFERFAIVPGLMAASPLDFEHYPYSHSLLTLSAIATLSGLGYWVARRDRRGSVVIALLVASHWLLDFIVHRPDLPLLPGSAARAGIGLWNSIAGTLLVELALLAIGAGCYVRTHRIRDRLGTGLLIGLLALLVLIQFANVFGPPPPSTNAVTYSALAVWLLVAWAWAIDARTEPRGVV